MLNFDVSRIFLDIKLQDSFFSMNKPPISKISISFLTYLIRPAFSRQLIPRNLLNGINMFRTFKKLHQVLPKHSRVFDSGSHRMPHYTYTHDTTTKIAYKHLEPKNLKDRIAQSCIKFIRSSYDYFTKYDPSNMTERRWISRCLLLETVAGVPGMVGGMARHLRSLRTLERDNGWIHHLVEQADNERFHLLIFLNLRRPSVLERFMILTIQGVFMNSFFIAYLLNGKFCHRFVGYLEEEAVKTYTTMLEHIVNPEGVLHHWNKKPAPQEVIDYYQLNANATYYDVILSIRADQACHRETNHFLADVESNFDIAEEKAVVYYKGEPQKEKKTENAKI